MTTDEFYGELADYITAKTGLQAIWSGQQARNPNAGKPVAPGMTSKDLRKYAMLAPGPQIIHSVHKVPDKNNPGQTIDMLPLEVQFTVSGIECEADELRPVWSTFMRDDRKTNISEHWSILDVGTLGYSPIYEKAEWKPRYVFSSTALIYDWFEEPGQTVIDSVTITHSTIWRPARQGAAWEGSITIP